MSVLILKIQECASRLISREEGQDLVEYALLVSLLALAAIAILGHLGGTIANVFSNVNTSLT